MFFIYFILNKVVNILSSFTALFYNNCMYLAHELALLGIECATLLQQEVVFTFVDFIEPLRSLGNSVFNSQIDTQRDQLLEILESSGLY